MEALLIMSAVIMLCVLALMLPEVPDLLNRRRRLKTPPCSKCGHMRDGEWLLTRCAEPSMMDREERLRGYRPSPPLTMDVRGTKDCRFEWRDGE